MARSRKSGLGKGIDSLIPLGLDLDEIQEPVREEGNKKGAEENNEAGENDRLMVEIDRIIPNEGQPRKIFDETSLNELADSIRQYGVIQPLLVQKEGDSYRLIAGERRLRAAKIAGSDKVPVIIKEYAPAQLMEISLIENIQRQDLNPIEEAQAYKCLIDEYGLRHEELAARVSKSRASVTNSLRLLKLDERVREKLIEGSISTGHARALLALADGDEQYKLAERIIEEDLSVRETEKAIKELSEPKKKKETPKKNMEEELFYKNAADRLCGALSTKVSIKRKNDGAGRIEIDYYSLEELERLMDLLEEAGD